MASSLPTRSLVALAVVALALPVFAQDGQGKEGGDGKPPAPPAPAPAAAPAPDVQDLLVRMRNLHARTVSRPDTTPQPGDDLEKQAARAKAEEDWRGAVKALARTSDEYLRAIGDAAPDAQALYYRGFAKFRCGAIVSTGEAQACYEAAADALGRYVAAATDEKAAFLAEAESFLGRSLLFVCGNDAARFDEAIAHLRRAVLLFQKDERHDEAGEAAWSAMAPLQNRNGGADLRAFADAIHASEGDFGASTTNVRALAQSGKIAVGWKLPSPPKAKDVDGKDLDFGPSPGKPLLIHFFQTGNAIGLPTKSREVQDEIRPLWEQYREKGLRVVGICMDVEFPKDRAEAVRKQWEEWGRKEKFSDGSLAHCREWAAEKGVSWPWYWDGLWTKNPLSNALGGMGQERPQAILVDGDGVIRWIGKKAPFEGLADEVGKLLK